ncbi:hypothetical protein AA105894_0039 [Asaia spathodeae NBRC 105894]|nr:hypothetical protein AA105894_0039 [Asaia spathodeae NBRC 105894]
MAAEGWHLIAEAFTPAGRHDDEDVLARHDGTDHILLLSAKGVETKDALEYRIRSFVNA